MVRVVYIDDDAGLGRLLQKALKGFDIVSVESGSEGLRRLESEAFDVVALDHDLGTETGLDVLPRIRALPQPPPVIYVTGSDDIRIAVAALKAGAADYVWKDVQGHYRELLRESIAAAMERAKLEREREEANRLISEARDRAEALLAEVNHRVANSLALVAALAQLQASAVEDEAARTALHKMRARGHRRPSPAPLHRAGRSRGRAQGVSGFAHRGTPDGDRVWCPASHPFHEHRGALGADGQSHLAGVIATELITNAVKYAYPKGTAADIRVYLERSADSGFILAVEDDGVGMHREGPVRVPESAPGSSVPWQTTCRDRSSTGKRLREAGWSCTSKPGPSPLRQALPGRSGVFRLA